MCYSKKEYKNQNKEPLLFLLLSVSFWSDQRVLMRTSIAKFEYERTGKGKKKSEECEKRRTDILYIIKTWTYSISIYFLFWKNDYVQVWEEL